MFCNGCRSYVRGTSRHCKICARCVDYFDHHCVWINNCIGGPNYSIFMVMVLSAFIYNVLFIVAVAEVGKKVSWAEEAPLMAVSSILLLPSAAIAILLVILAIFHFYLIANNTNTFDFLTSNK